MGLPIDFAVLGANLMKVNPGLTFWTLVTFLVAFLVLRWKAWGPILQSVKDREKRIQDSLDTAKAERQEAERVLEEQKQAMLKVRQETAELTKKSLADVEKIRQELLTKNKKEAEEILQNARRQIEEEKAKALGEIRQYAVDLALQAAQKLVEISLDESKQRALVSDFIERVDQKRPAA